MRSIGAAPPSPIPPLRGEGDLDFGSSIGEASQDVARGSSPSPLRGGIRGLRHQRQVAP
jgi:hypothetical protein